MKISDLLRWGPRKTAPTPIEKHLPASFQERRYSQRRRVQGPAQLWWVSGAGDVVRGDGSFTDAGDEGIGAELNKPAPVGKTAWFAFDNEQPWPAIIRHCEASEGGFSLGATVEPLAATTQDSGSVGLEWFDGDGVLQFAGANVRSGKEGHLELNSESAAPEREIVLIKGAEVCFLAVTARCEARGDRHFVEVVVLTEAAPKYCGLAA